MKWLKTLLLLCLLAMLCSCEKEHKAKLIMVTNATFPPYEYMAGNEIDGIDPAVVRLAVSRMGYDLEIRDMSFDSLIPAVQSGKAHIAAAGITVTEERKKQVLFTLPYVISKQVILVRKNSSIRGVKDLKGKRIGVQHGTTGDTFVAKHIQEPERFTNNPLAVTALLSGKIDVAIMDSEPAEVFVSRRNDLKILDEELTKEEYAFAFSKHNQTLCNEFNAELKKMIESGELNSIIERYKELHSREATENTIIANTLFGRLKDSFYMNFIKDQRYKYLLNGFSVTIQITIFAVLLGILIGFCVAVIRTTADQTGKFFLLNQLCKLYLTVIRGTPVVVQLLIIYFVIFRSVNIDKVFVAILAFGINSGAYVAEIIRGGIMSIDKGQMEGGRSLGLSYFQTMREIILPQAFKNVLPALGNEFIVLLKETSVAGYIALQDLTKAGDVIRAQTYDAFLPLLAVALIYLIVVVFLSRILGCLEKRLKKYE